MAVYTKLSAEDLSDLIHQYDVGELVSAKGIAEGVSNSNWLIETSGHGRKRERFILTMYESRVEISDLPFFLGLLDHLAEKGSPVPRTIHDLSGAAYRIVDGKAAALIEFLPGISVDLPNPAQAYAVGEALAGLHLNSADFTGRRENTMGLAAWRELFDGCGEDGLKKIDKSLPGLVAEEMNFLTASWPRGLPRSVIHADLFPDNVLLLENKVSGLIDFYFACRDITAYDFAVTHSAWSFSSEGEFRPEVAAALAEGYVSTRPLADAERAALPVLARGAAMRFMATRAYDWLHTPADAMVTRKDPMDLVHRLAFYTQQGSAAFPGL